MTNIQKSVPVLRFKDEQGKGYPDWEEKKLGETGKVVTGKTPSTMNKSLWDGEIQFITPSDINDDNKYQISTERYIKQTKDIRVLPPKSIIYTCIASIGKICISVKPCATNQQINALTPSNRYDSEFIYYSLLKLTPRIKATQATTTLPIINKTEFKKINMSIPCLSEQQKIASFLSSVDTKIEQLGKKKALLEHYKKGMMQKLFSQDIRFKDEQGKGYPDWEEKKLGETGKVVTGKTPSTMNKSLWDGEIQFITPSDINDDNKYQISTERYIKQTKDIRVLPPKSIIYTCIASIGKICISVKPCATNQQINALTPSNRYDSEFIYYSLLKLTPRIKATQATTTLPIINKTEFKKINMSIPCLSEQQKIAAFLVAIDKKIELVAAQFKQAQILRRAYFNRCLFSSNHIWKNYGRK